MSLFVSCVVIKHQLSLAKVGDFLDQKDMGMISITLERRVSEERLDILAIEVIFKTSFQV